jgi:hypothetical protein
MTGKCRAEHSRNLGVTNRWAYAPDHGTPPVADLTYGIHLLVHRSGYGQRCCNGQEAAGDIE